jgi:hypothetical protein
MSVNFRDTKVQLGRDLGPVTNIGPAMARTILKSNDQITYKTNVISMMPEERASVN